MDGEPTSQVATLENKKNSTVTSSNYTELCNIWPETCSDAFNGLDISCFTLDMNTPHWELNQTHNAYKETG